jgi:hypothetical protein
MSEGTHLPLAVGFRGLLGGLLCGVLLALLADAQAQTLSETRTSSFTYRATDGLLQSETVEPDSPNLCVKTVYDYDAVGNRNSSNVQPCGGVQAKYSFTARRATTDYEQYNISVLGVAMTVPANTFPTRVTNALNQSETRRYDPRFGTVVSQTGPNGLTTSWTLDDFGRRVRETAADSTHVEVFYCSIANPSSADTDGCASLPALTPPGDAAVFVHSQPRAANGAVNGPYARVYYDRAAREIRTVTQGFVSGGGDAPVIYRDTRYGRYGGKEWQSEPYFRDTGRSQYVSSGVTSRPTVTASFSPAAVTWGQNYTFSWASTNATAINASCEYASRPGGPWSGGLAVPGGSSNGTPDWNGLANCTVTATGPGGTSSTTAQITSACPSGTSWSGSSCVALPPTVTLSPTALNRSRSGSGWVSGSITAIVAGGQAPFTYAWTAANDLFTVANAQSATATVSAMVTAGESEAGGVTVTVTDALGRSVTARASVTFSASSRPGQPNF